MSRGEPFDLEAVLADDSLLDALGPQAHSDARIRARFGDDMLVEALLQFRRQHRPPAPTPRAGRRPRTRAAVVAALVVLLGGLAGTLGAGTGPTGSPPAFAAHTVDRYLRLAAADLASGDRDSARTDINRARTLLTVVPVADGRNELEQRWTAIDRTLHDTAGPPTPDRAPQNSARADGPGHTTAGEPGSGAERDRTTPTAITHVDPADEARPAGVEQQATRHPTQDPLPEGGRAPFAHSPAPELQGDSTPPPCSDGEHDRMTRAVPSPELPVDPQQHPTGLSPADRSAASRDGATPHRHAPPATTAGTGPNGHDPVPVKDRMRKDEQGPGRTVPVSFGSAPNARTGDSAMEGRPRGAADQPSDPRAAFQDPVPTWRRYADEQPRPGPLASQTQGQRPLGPLRERRLREQGPPAPLRQAPRRSLGQME